MANEPPESDSPPVNNDPQGPAIRRGQGLRLSTSSPTPDDTNDTAPPPAAATPKRRGAGLRLSTHADPDTDRAEPVAPATVSTHAIRFNQRQISYQQVGSGPPLVLIHGWGAAGRCWQGTQLHLADIRQSFALDLPGFGASPPLPVPMNIPRQAEQVIAWANALGLQQFDLNGHDFGAAVAAYLSARWPQRVRRLVLTCLGVQQSNLGRTLQGVAQLPMNLALNLSQPLLNFWQPWLRPWQSLYANLLHMPPIPRIWAGWMMNNVPSDATVLRENLADLTRMDLRAHLACVISAGDPELIYALSHIHVPTLLIAGSTDKFTPPAQVAAAYTMVPGSRMLELEHCGHLPMFEQAAAYHQALRDFFLAEGW